MFRFSIRELMLVTLVAALAVAWFTEHRSSQEAMKQSEKLLARNRRLNAEMDSIAEQLEGYGLGLLRTMYADNRPGATVFGTRKESVGRTTDLLGKAP